MSLEFSEVFIKHMSFPLAYDTVAQAMHRRRTTLLGTPKHVMPHRYHHKAAFCYRLLFYMATLHSLLYLLCTTHAHTPVGTRSAKTGPHTESYKGLYKPDAKE